MTESQSGLPQAAVAAAAGAIAAHRWKSMGATSTECECGAILHGDAAPFPADEAFRAHLAEATLAAAAPHLATAERDLLAEAGKTLWACAKAFLTVEHTLDAPYPDDPRWSPWTRWCELPARAAHDLHVRIRRHLKTPIPSEGDPEECQP